MTRWTIGRAARVAAELTVAGVVLLMPTGTVAARDNGGVIQFFQPSSGTGAAARPGSSGRITGEVADAEIGRVRTLTVRPRRSPRAVAAAMPGKPGMVSIFEDTTLRKGDAVMTADGLRIFAGSSAWPYTRADFVDLAKSRRQFSKAATKVLAELDRRPRG